MFNLLSLLKKIVLREVILKKGVKLHLLSTIKSRGKVVVGDYTNFAGPVTVQGSSNLTIGKFCAVGRGVKIITSNHDINEQTCNSNFVNNLILSCLYQQKVL